MGASYERHSRLPPAEKRPAHRTTDESPVIPELLVDPGDSAQRLADRLVSEYSPRTREELAAILKVAVLRAKRRRLRLSELAESAFGEKQLVAGNKSWPGYLRILIRRLGDWVLLKGPLDSAASGLWSRPNDFSSWLVPRTVLSDLSTIPREVTSVFRRGAISSFEVMDTSSVYHLIRGAARRVQRATVGSCAAPEQDSEGGVGLLLDHGHVSAMHAAAEVLRFRLEDEMAAIRRSLVSGRLQEAWEDLVAQTSSHYWALRPFAFLSPAVDVEKQLTADLEELNSAELIARKQRKGQGLQLTLPLFREHRTSM